MGEDLLAGAQWCCVSVDPGSIEDPGALEKAELGWLDADVPGTAAGALRRAGRLGEADAVDETEWWFRTEFSAEDLRRSYVLRLGGLATLADVWLNGEHVLHSENMFLRHDVNLTNLADENALVLRFSSLRPFLDARRPRPRWKSYLVVHPNLRWLRTTLLGRIPGWVRTPAAVGPWREVRIVASDAPFVRTRRVTARCGADGEGEVRVDVRLSGVVTVPDRATLHLGDERAPLTCSVDGDGVVVTGGTRLSRVERWWPHTHGPQPLYPISLELDGKLVELGRVGFRTLEAMRADGEFGLCINGVEVFCRGAVWMPIDPVSLAPSTAELRAALELVRDAGMNMIRLPGTGVYEVAAFWDLCDELGILVWQDAMLAFSDPPSEHSFTAQILEELTQVCGDLGGRPSLAVFCGGQEIHSQAAMLGIPRPKWSVPLLEEIVPELVARELPGTPYVPSNPYGGDLPFQMDEGVSHYFGIGGYMRRLGDVRRDRVRFATEALAFATPPESYSLDEHWGASWPAGHDPSWKRGVHRDAKRSWDLEDVQQHYLGQLFELDPFLLRREDSDRALDLSRATSLVVMTEAMSEWRRSASPCAGALVLAARDLMPGAGWGICDAAGMPKAPWFGLRRILQPVALLLTDEGLNGVHLHLVNDGPDPVDGSLAVALYAHGEVCIASASTEVTVPARSTETVAATSLFEEWWDVTQSYGFGAPAFDVLGVTFIGADERHLGDAVHFLGARARSIEPDIGLEARVARNAAGQWVATITSRRVAQWVVIDVPGYRPADSWFHLAPGSEREVILHPTDACTPAVPQGSVRALNCLARTRITADRTAD